MTEKIDGTNATQLQEQQRALAKELGEELEGRLRLPLDVSALCREGDRLLAEGEAGGVTDGEIQEEAGGGRGHPVQRRRFAGGRPA